MRNQNKSFSFGVLALFALAGCGDIFEVSSPGRTRDEDLSSTDAFPALVVGMSYDYADALDAALQEISLASEDLWHGGSYDFGDIPRGTILPEDVNTMWGEMHQARWVAETGIQRMDSIYSAQGTTADFNKSAIVARAYLFAGLSNRLLGENVCDAVIDGSARQPHTVHFDRALQQFTRAIEIGTAAGSGAADITNAAYGGRASMKAWKGDWAGAAVDAARVPTPFVYTANYQLPSPDNDLAYETHTRFEFTVWGTMFEPVTNDPRVPWRIARTSNGRVATGQNGSTPMYQQTKYTNQAADIPVVKGTEMRVLQAEAALRNNNIPGAFTLLNQSRAFYGMQPLPVPTSLDAAWETLRFERRATLWIEGRALWDLRRWFNEQGPAHDDFLKGRQGCIPVSERELESNINLRG